MSPREKAAFALWVLTCPNTKKKNNDDDGNCYKIYLVEKYQGIRGVIMIFFTDKKLAFSYPEDFDFPAKIDGRQSFIAIEQSKYSSVIVKTNTGSDLS